MAIDIPLAQRTQLPPGVTREAFKPGWTITEAKSGLAFATGRTQVIVRQQAEKTLASVGIAGLESAIGAARTAAEARTLREVAPEAPVEETRWERDDRREPRRPARGER